MAFNSIAYLLFLPTVFVLYWMMQKYPPRWQNALLLAASYVFYGWWDWRCLGLLIFSTCTDFGIGRWLMYTQHQRMRRFILIVSLVINLGLLSFF